MKVQFPAQLALSILIAACSSQALASDRALNCLVGLTFVDVGDSPEVTYELDNTSTASGGPFDSTNIKIEVAYSIGFKYKSSMLPAGTTLVDTPASNTLELTIDSVDASAKTSAGVTFEAVTAGSWNLTGRITAGTPLDPVPSNDNCDVAITVNALPIVTSTNSSANHLSTLTTADPVNTLNAELINDFKPDFDLGGPLPVFISRYYASELAADANVTNFPFGTNWLHNYAFSFSQEGAEIKIINNRGREIIFTQNGTQFDLVSPLDIRYQLVTSGSDFILGTQIPQRIYVFNNTGLLTRIADGRGNQHSLSYDGSNRLSQVNDGLGRSLTLSYDINDHITRVSDGTRNVDFNYLSDDLSQVTDTRGNTTSYSYAAGGLLTQILLPEGNARYSQVFNTNRQVTSQTDAAANTTNISVDEASRQTTVTLPDGGVMRHDYKASGQLAALNDQSEQTITLSSDAEGRRNLITDREGDATSYTWGSMSGLLTQISDSNSGITNIEYTSHLVDGVTFYDRSKITYPDTTTQLFAYDAQGNMTKHTNQREIDWTYTYNDVGQILTASSPLSGVTTNTYNADGTLATRKDASGNTQSFTYDSLKRAISITRADTSSRNFQYDAKDNITRVADELGNQTNLSYDKNNNLTQISFPNAMGDPGASISYEYDDMDRLIRTSDPVGNTTGATFNSHGMISSFTDGRDKVSSFSYNSLDRLSSVTDPLSSKLNLNYDLEGILSSTNIEGQTGQSFTSGSKGRVAETKLASEASYVYERDSLGFITQVTNPLGNITSVTRDPKGMVIGIASPEPSITSTLSRNLLGQIVMIKDGNNNQWARTFDSAGRPSSIKDPLGNTSNLSYDNRNRVSRVDYADGSNLALSYDSVGNTLSRVYSGGTVVNQQFDSRGMITSASGANFDYDDAGQMINSNGLDLTRNGNGNISTIDYGGGFVVTYIYADNEQLMQVSDTKGTQIDFSYDGSRRLIGIARSNNVASSISYDINSQVSNLSDATGSSNLSNLTYTRNEIGLITNIDRTQPLMPSAAGLINIEYTFNAASQISNSGYQYNLRGQLVTMPEATYSWTGDNNLASKTVTQGSGTTQQYQYDAFDQLTQRDAVGLTIKYKYNYAFGFDLPMLATENDGTQDTRHYVHTPKGKPLYFYDLLGNMPYFYHLDAEGNTLYLTDDEGVVAQSYAYGPFGRRLGTSGDLDNPFTWRAGVRYMNIGGSLHLGEGVFDSSLGSLLAPVKVVDPVNTNPYAMANDQPLKYGLKLKFNEFQLSYQYQGINNDELSMFGDQGLAISMPKHAPYLPRISERDANSKLQTTGYTGETYISTVSEDPCSCDTTGLSIGGTLLFTAFEKGSKFAAGRFTQTGQRILQRGLSGGGFAGLATNGNRAAAAKGLAKASNIAGNTFSGALGAYTELKQCQKEGSSTASTAVRVINSGAADALVSAALGPVAIIDAATGGNVSNAVKAPLRVITALAGDSRATRAYERAVENGDYGVCMQGWHMIGEKLEEKTELSDYLVWIFQ